MTAFVSPENPVVEDPVASYDRIGYENPVAVHWATARSDLGIAANPSTENPVIRRPGGVL
jgi:hypothetical protein